MPRENANGQRGNGNGGRRNGNGTPRYDALIETIFFNHYREGVEEFVFERDEMRTVATELGIRLPDNLGDVVYSFRYRKPLPQRVRDTAPEGKEWLIIGAGRSRYRFSLEIVQRIAPREDLATIKVPNSTPEIIAAYAIDDEQALLAKVRYNRLIDLFLGITAYSLQNHLRTFVQSLGQIEIDEVYVGVDKHGRQYVVPVQAKGGNDRHSIVQVRQDVQFCAMQYPQLVCRSIAAQFMSDDRIALFELGEEDGRLCVVQERHYKLVPASGITDTDLETYRNRVSD